MSNPKTYYRVTDSSSKKSVPIRLTTLPPSVIEAIPDSYVYRTYKLDNPLKKVLCIHVIPGSREPGKKETLIEVSPDFNLVIPKC